MAGKTPKAVGGPWPSEAQTMAPRKSACKIARQLGFTMEEYLYYVRENRYMPCKIQANVSNEYLFKKPAVEEHLSMPVHMSIDHGGTQEPC